MTLGGAKELLKKNNIPFELSEFESESAYWYHTMLYPYTCNANSCKVIVLIIRSLNARKNIELQFNMDDDVFCFEELRFGEYCYEMFDCVRETLAKDLVENILAVMQGNTKIIVWNDLKRKRWLGDAYFDLGNDNVLEELEFQKAMQKIKEPKGFFGKLLKSKTQYEIYDWNTYQCIIK